MYEAEFRPEQANPVPSYYAYERDQEQSALRHEMAVADHENEFMAAALRGDMDAPAQFMPRVTDYDNKQWPADVLPRPKRMRTIGETLFESLESTKGPQFDDVFSLLASAARGEPVKQQALNLIQRMAAQSAWMNVED